ncbi:phage/plasmid primase, P4 family [Methylobacterium sp. M6A4_1b]
MNMIVSPSKINTSPADAGDIFADNCDRYWDAGLPVMPLRAYTPSGGKDGKPTGKEPVLPSWQEMQSRMPTDAERVSWKRFYRTGNIGLPLGPQSGLVAVDIDSDDPAVFDALNRILPPSPWQRIGRKGMVRIYHWNGDIETFRIKCRDAAGKLQTLVEVLGAGSQIVLPPSIHPNTVKAYTANRHLVDCLDEVQFLPADIEAQMRKALAEVGYDVTAAKGAKPVRGSRGTIGEGSRNDTLFREASRLRGQGHDEEAVCALLAIYNRKNCDQPLGDDEVASIAASAMRYDPNEWFEMNDTGNAERFVRDHGDVVRYVPDKKIWRLWTGTHWADDPGALNMIRLARETVEGIRADADAAPKVEVQKALKAHARASGQGTRLRAMVDVAASMPDVAALSTEFDNLPGKLVVMNGVIDLETGALSPHDPTLLNTRCIPTAYDPTAAAPRFEAAMMRVQPDPVVRDFLRIFFGQALHGTRPEQIMVWLHGRGGRNGKSFLTDLLLKVLPGYAIETSASAFVSDDKRSPNGPRSDLARFEGSRIVFGQESTDGRRLDSQRLKQLTGDATYTTRANHENERVIPITFSMAVASNPWPNANEADDALWARFVRVPYDVVIPREERIPNFYAIIYEAEAAGVLAWVVRGAVEYARSGLSIPEVLIKATEAWRRRIGTVLQFMQASTRCVETAGAQIELVYLQAKYVKFVQQAYGAPLGREDFRTRLEQLGYAVEDTEHGAQVLGIQPGVGVAMGWASGDRVAA